MQFLQYKGVTQQKLIAAILIIPKKFFYYSASALNFLVF